MDQTFRKGLFHVMYSFFLSSFDILGIMESDCCDVMIRWDLRLRIRWDLRL